MLLLRLMMASITLSSGLFDLNLEDMLDFADNGLIYYYFGLCKDSIEAIFFKSALDNYNLGLLADYKLVVYYNLLA